MKTVQSVSVDDKATSLIQDRLIAAVLPLQKLPLSDSNHITDVGIVSGTNLINHGLGRVLLGYIVTKKSANVDIYDSQATNLMASTKLALVSSGTATIDIIVF